MVRQKQRYTDTSRTIRFWRPTFALAFMLCLGLVGTAAATQTSSSTNYSVTESQFGGGSQQQCSTTYCAKSAAGDTVVGQGSSTSYSAQFGGETTNEPLLKEIVETSAATQDMGVLDDTHTGTALATIKVRSYLSSGYVLQITGPPPSQGAHSLATMSTSCPCTSQQGAEQFGINFADNTAPDIGAPPVQVPSGSYSFGDVTSDYGTADLFKYVDGDIVAQSSSSTGETDYTMSMIVNVSNATPGGKYTGVFSAVAVPVF